MILGPNMFPCTLVFDPCITMNNYHPLFTGIVISYLYKKLKNIGLIFDWFQRHHMDPFTNDLSLRKKTCSSLKWKVKIVYPLNLDCKDRSDWLADNNNLI